MRYIVTGGAGFIGSNLADTLAQHHDVVVIDNLATGRRENIEHLLDHPRVTFIEGSITDLNLLMETFPGADGIFHQAAIPSVPRSVEKPLETNAVNVGGTVNVLWAAKECGVPTVVAASTSAIYGDDPVFPKHETMAPTPLSPRGLKTAGEHYGKVFSDLYGIRTAFLRYFNVFGPRQDRTPSTGGDPEVRHPPARRETADHLRRRGADPRLHLRRRRGAGEHPGDGGRCPGSLISPAAAGSASTKRCLSLWDHRHACPAALRTSESGGCA